MPGEPVWDRAGTATRLRALHFPSLSPGSDAGRAAHETLGAQVVRPQRFLLP